MKFREPNLKHYRDLPTLVIMQYRKHNQPCLCTGCCDIRIARNELAIRNERPTSMEDAISMIPELRLEQILIHLKKKTSKLR